MNLVKLFILFIFIILAFLATGCSTTVPVKRTFPTVPDELKVMCPDLIEVPEGTTELSGVLKVVTDNYAQYKECAIKVDLWTDWYEKQKKTFEEVK
jgi:hypothetical protein